MDLNFPVFTTGVRIFKASNDVGPLFVGPGSTRILENTFVGPGSTRILKKIHLCFSSIRVDPGPTNKGSTSLLALKIRTPVENTGKLRSIGQMSVPFPCTFQTRAD